MYRFFVLITLLISLICQESKVKKSTSILKSIAIPGWGNLAAGNKTAGYIHLGTEVTLWIGYFYNKKVLNDSRVDYRNFAKTRLNLNYTNYPNDYFEIIASYNSYEQYKLIQLARGENPNSLLSEDYQWQWNSDSERRFYNEKLNESAKFERNISLWFYGMAANRLISILTTNRDVKRANGFNANADVGYNDTQGNQVKLNLSYSF